MTSSSNTTVVVINPVKPILRNSLVASILAVIGVIEFLYGDKLLGINFLQLAALFEISALIK